MYSVLMLNKLVHWSPSLVTKCLLCNNKARLSCKTHCGIAIAAFAIAMSAFVMYVEYYVLCL